MSGKSSVVTHSSGFILLSALSLLLLCIIALSNEQPVMDLGDVKSNNADTLNSIRGVYGSIGPTLFILQ